MGGSAPRIAARRHYRNLVAERSCFVVVVVMGPKCYHGVRPHHCALLGHPDQRFSKRFGRGQGALSIAMPAKVYYPNFIVVIVHFRRTVDVLGALS